MLKQLLKGIMAGGGWTFGKAVADGVTDFAKKKIKERQEKKEQEDEDENDDIDGIEIPEDEDKE